MMLSCWSNWMLWIEHRLLHSVSPNAPAGSESHKLQPANVCLFFHDPDDMYAELLEQLDAVECALPPPVFSLNK